MKNTYISIIVLVILAGGLYFVMNSQKMTTPAMTDDHDGSMVMPTPTPSTTLCTQDAKICPDGSSVGRVAPSCEFAACPTVSIGGSVSTGAVKQFTVSGQNFSFSPSTITVNKGDKVKITFKNTQGFHDFVIDEYGVATKQASSPAEETIEFTADKTGTFEYYCSVGSHRQMGMKGTLTVK